MPAEIKGKLVDTKVFSVVQIAPQNGYFVFLSTVHGFRFLNNLSKTRSSNRAVSTHRARGTGGS
jgi:hypothetical protein